MMLCASGAGITVSEMLAAAAVRLCASVTVIGSE